MICRSTSGSRRRAFKSELVQIQLINEGVNDAYRIVFADEIIEALR
jgi:hypothetical protein